MGSVYLLLSYQLLPPPPLQLLQLPQQRPQQPLHPPHHPPAPQSQALLLARTVFSPSPFQAPPMSPAQSGSMGGRTRAASGAPPRWIARVFMLTGRVIMASVGLTAILTQCLWQRFLRVLLGPMLGQLVRRTRTQWCLEIILANLPYLNKFINKSSSII